MDGGEDDDEADGDAKDVGGNESAAADPVTVEEAVRVKALLGGGDVGDAQIGEQTKDKPGQVGPRQGIGARDKDLEEGEGRVEGVLADVAPGVKDAGEPGRAEEDGPVDEADDDGQGDDGRVKERVQHERDAAVNRNRRTGRKILAWGHALPEMAEADFFLPEEYRDQDMLKARERKKRRDKRGKRP
ncbi:hypothetical protein OCS_04676 [Ophiocordyceps sinensis CO18]|uniref:Uncharacterized protein n=1 Tax=Ophiocordyceps sinensis (strain Co18 / CGMCC 3.14243) TaxID=911162 RepID=T5AB35_OPHSC|nr:hypothetical protein OCS_04676 [Ophiocordyceps sinensis CO18]